MTMSDIAHPPPSGIRQYALAADFLQGLLAPTILGVAVCHYVFELFAFAGAAAFGPFDGADSDRNWDDEHEDLVPAALVRKQPIQVSPPG